MLFFKSKQPIFVSYMVFAPQYNVPYIKGWEVWVEQSNHVVIEVQAV